METEATPSSSQTNLPEKSDQHPSLFERISNLKHTSTPPLVTNSTNCPLSEPVPCSFCRGKGIRLAKPNGAFAQVEICVCVRSCKSCQGSAVRQGQDSHGLRTAKNCISPSPQRRANLFNQANIPLRYATARLSRLDAKSEQMQQVGERIQHWIGELKSQDPASPCRGFILQGDVGIGKTFLAAATAKHLAYHGYGVKFVDFFQLITEIKIRHSQQLEWTSSLFTPLIEVEFLIIDELGKGRRTEFEQTVIDQLVAQRYNRNKTIIATTNCTLESQSTHLKKEGDYSSSDFSQSSPLIQAVGARVYSRLLEMCSLWKISDAEDLRELMAQRSRDFHMGLE
ncbi:MAG: ATP-binding protein [Zetaproteobacteria bacterium]|nr:ATP-binding protein [Zetaproteobacteria bacterium]